MEIDLRWVASLPASGLHAADALRRGRRLAPTPIASVIAGPAERLIEEVRQADLPEERFWGHLVALSAEMEESRQLTETVLHKTIGRDPRTARSLAPIAAALTMLQGAVRRAIPDLVEQVAVWAQPLIDTWNRLGPVMLEVAAQRTEPGLMAPHAGVVGMYPALGGDGVAHLWYNTVRIEVAPSDPFPEVPEVVRLAWLISQLQTDLPVFSETIPRDRLHAIAAAAMLPAALAAAQEVELVARGRLPIQRALAAWQPTELGAQETAEAIRSWWETYAESRPPWNVALAALNEMLFAQTSVPC